MNNELSCMIEHSLQVSAEDRMQLIDFFLKIMLVYEGFENRFQDRTLKKALKKMTQDWDDACCNLLDHFMLNNAKF